MGKRAKQRREARSPYTAPKPAAPAPTSPPPSPPEPVKVPGWDFVRQNGGKIAPFLLGVLGLCLAIWTWSRTAHPIVDYGREIYVPWRITEGAVLHKDLAYFNGPLSPYLNALWLTLFGVSLATLRIVNIVLLAGVTFVIWKIARKLSDAWTANLACSIFLIGMGFGHLMGWGTFNWVEPYSHEMTHGVGLSLVTVWLLMQWHERHGKVAIALAGLCLGLTFLTKPEIFVACGLACVTAITLPYLTTRRPPLIGLALFAGGAIVPVAIAYALLSSALESEQAMQGLLGGWPHVFNDELRDQQFYKSGMGIMFPLIRLEHLAWTLVMWVAIFGTAFLVARRRRTVPPAGVGFFVIAPLVAITIVSAVVLENPTEWVRAFSYRAFPWLYIPVALVLFVGFLRRRSDNPVAGMQRLTLLALAAVLLGKMLLNVHPMQYGFGLTVPTTIFMCAMLLSWLPGWVAKNGGHGWTMRAPGIAILGIMPILFLMTAARSVPAKTFPLREGGDRMLITPYFGMSDSGAHDDAGARVEKTLRAIEEKVPKNATLVVLPEGIIWNYWLRRPSSVRHINYMPPEIIMFGEANILTDLKASPPDYIVLVERETVLTYGKPFGDMVQRRPDGQLGLRAGYAPNILRWVRDNYRRIHHVGPTPLVPERLRDFDFGTEIYKRK